MFVSPDDRANVDLDLAIEGAIEFFNQDFKERWALNGNEPPTDVDWEEWYELLSLREAARKLVAAALHLFRPGGLTRRDVNLPAQLVAAAEAEETAQAEFLRQLKALGNEDQNWQAMEAFLKPRLPDPERLKYRFFSTALQMELAERALPSLYSMSNRLLKLLDHLASESDAGVLRYLERVAHCYIYDMPLEMAVMARALVEAALEKRLPSDYMRKVRGIRKHERVSLSLLIDEAAAAGLLDGDTEVAAKWIKENGDAAAHGRSGSSEDPDLILANLHAVVSALSTRRERMK